MVVYLDDSSDTNETVLRNQPPKVFHKKVVLKNFAVFTGKHLCWSLFLIKWQAWRPFEENLWTAASGSAYIAAARELKLIKKSLPVIVRKFWKTKKHDHTTAEICPIDVHVICEDFFLGLSTSYFMYSYIFHVIKNK